MSWSCWSIPAPSTVGSSVLLAEACNTPRVPNLFAKASGPPGYALAKA
jgi:hypothetical protein